MAFVRPDASEELTASFTRVTRIGEVRIMLAVTSNRSKLIRGVRRLLVTANVILTSPILVTLMKKALISSETSVLTRATGLTSQKTPFFKHTVAIILQLG
jgi:hypothetical protein